MDLRHFWGLAHFGGKQSFTVLGMCFLVFSFLVLFMFTGGLQKTLSFLQAHTKSRDETVWELFWAHLRKSEAELGDMTPTASQRLRLWDDSRKLASASRKSDTLLQYGQLLVVAP